MTTEAEAATGEEAVVDVDGLKDLLAEESVDLDDDAMAAAMRRGYGQTVEDIDKSQLQSGTEDDEQAALAAAEAAETAEATPAAAAAAPPPPTPAAQAARAAAVAPAAPATPAAVGFKPPAEDSAMERRVRELEGRIGILNRELGKVAASNTRKAGDRAPTETQIATAAAAGDDDAWTALLNQFPDWANGLGKMRADIEAKIPDVAKLHTELAETRQLLDADAKARVELGTDVVRTLRPQFDTIMASKEFWAWLPKQPAHVQILAQSPLPSDAIKLVDIYRPRQDIPAVPEPTKPGAAAKPEQQRLADAIPATNARGATRPTRARSELEMMRVGYAGKG